ncbi:P-loop containing nucleoside triphosphate hydrolase protein [Melanogaster broomeanus]|nr:P-loop containing nucleoside triphosphate hydrolase protein [Melanogaster broomeanus]
MRGHGRGLLTTSLARAPATAYALKPQQAPAMSEEQTDRSHVSAMKFADAPISEKSKKAIRHQYLTDVQEATLELGLSGADLLVQAKTGTGKTTAFLLPAIEQLVKKPLPPRGAVSILVLSPTRELAIQIQKEAETLIRTHPFSVQSVIGGSRQASLIQQQKRDLAMKRCDILVATPGRLLDLLETTDLRQQLRGIQTLVLDEADRLLDQGFMDSLQSIFDCLPDRKQHPRQCMLYSATLSKDIKKVAALSLTPDYKFVSTLVEDEVNTHQHVSQTSITVPIGDSIKATLAVLQDDVAEHGNRSKSMVFCTTTMGTSATAQLLKQAGSGKLPQVFEIHSRLTQSRRSSTAEKFKAAKSAILVTSDVTARGMDFPGVTLVVQVGLPASSEQYIHRLGRTARAGRSGKGTIILTPSESAFLRTQEMKTLPIQPHPPLQLPDLPPTMLEEELQIKAYAAWLGFNASSSTPGMSKQDLVDEANKYAWNVLGWADKTTPPPISQRTVQMIGLGRVAGLNTNQEAKQQSRFDRGEGQSYQSGSSWKSSRPHDGSRFTGGSNYEDGRSSRYGREEGRDFESSRQSSRPQNRGWAGFRKNRS